jgi:hypothetical protein
MVHHHIALNLSPTHLRNIKKHLLHPNGKDLKIKLMPHHMVQGHHHMHVTDRQIQGLHKAKASGRGKMIKFSPTLLKHNMKAGSIFNDIWDKVKSSANFVKDILDVGKTAKNVYDIYKGQGRKRKKRRARGIYPAGVGYGIFNP